MRLRYFLTVSIASLLVLGCAENLPVGQSAQSPASVASALTQPTSLTAQASGSTLVKSGTFASGEHPTEGTVRIVTENGKNFLELAQNFKTSELGPDLHVILHRSDNVLGSTTPPAYPIQEGDYLVLGALQQFTGAQRYAIADDVNLADYQSAGIWCRKFNATFGAARLSG